MGTARLVHIHETRVLQGQDDVVSTADGDVLPVKIVDGVGDHRSVQGIAGHLHGKYFLRMAGCMGEGDECKKTKKDRVKGQKRGFQRTHFLFPTPDREDRLT